MNNMVTKLSSVAALLGVIGAIGAGFIQYGKIQAKLTELDKRKSVVNQTVDLGPVNDKISTLEVELIDRIEKVDGKIKPNISVTKTYLANRLLKFIFNNLQNFFTIIILNPGYNFNIIKIPINRWMIYPIFRHRPTK